MDRRVCGMCGHPLMLCNCSTVPAGKPVFRQQCYGDKRVCDANERNLKRLIEAAKAVVDEECCRVNPIGKEPYDPIANPSQFSHEIVELAQALEDIQN